MKKDGVTLNFIDLIYKGFDRIVLIFNDLE